MNQTWSALTLLLLGTVMLLVTWMSATRRILHNFVHARLFKKVSGGLIINLIGCGVALSGVMLFAAITVVTDAVSKAWCTCHGVIIHFLALLGAYFMVGLSLSLWAETTKAQWDEFIAHNLSHGSGTAMNESLRVSMAKYYPKVRAFLFRFEIGAILASLVQSFVVLISGSFEQRTLFCFSYEPEAMFILFQLAISLCMLVSSVFALWTGLKLLRLRPISLRRYLEKFQYEPINTYDNSNQSFADRETRRVQVETEYDDMKAAQIALPISRLKGKLVFLLCVLSIGGLIASMMEFVNTLNAASNEEFYKGDDVSSDDDVFNSHLHESELGRAVLLLAFADMAVFLVFTTDSLLWEMDTS